MPWKDEDAGQPKSWDKFEEAHRVLKMFWYIETVKNFPRHFYLNKKQRALHPDSGKVPTDRDN